MTDHVVDNDGKIVKSERTFFEEEDQVRADVAVMVRDPASLDDSAADAEEGHHGHAAVGNDQQLKDIHPKQQLALSSFTSKLEKYQEQSQLLDPYLENMVVPLMNQVQAIIRAKEQVAQGAEDEAASFPFQVYRNPHLQLLFHALYILCKIRGYKTIVKFLPHEVADLEPTLRLLQSQDVSDHTTWQTRYMLLLWMSILCMIPFDLTTVDSSFAHSGSSPRSGRTSQMSLIDTTLSICKGYLKDAGPTRVAAAICLSRLLTRPDMDSTHLGSFLEWSTLMLEDSADPSVNASGSPTSVFLVTGVYNALVEIFKRGHREQLVAHIPAIFERVLRLASRTGHISSLERKLSIKLVQRIGLNFLPPRVISWRYQRGHRSLLDNFNKAMNNPGNPAPVGKHDDDAGNDDDDDDDVDVPEDVEDVIEQLLCGLRDKDTIVRWSAAKGVGRITGRLPQQLADDVVAFVLELFDAAEGDSAWHGGCLALAELARRGLLLPGRLESVVPLVVKALVYDVRRGHNSVGAHVRDAACYVCWAFARAYAPDVMTPYVEDLARQMLVTALFDREVNCRRAASAAFQENVGRQGHENFPNGIDILTAADYFTLGIRANAYTSVAKYVAKYELYRHALIEHLVETKLAHWDLAIRTLSATALANLVPLEPEYFVTSVFPRLYARVLSPDIIVRHGATLAVAELVLALGNVPYTLPDDDLTEIRNLVMKIEKARLYRGRGGESMRLAACRLIESIALAGHPLSERAQLRLLDSIDESLRHPKPEVQRAAVAALRALSHEYFEPSSRPGGADVNAGRDNWRSLLVVHQQPVHDAIVSRTVDKYVDGLANNDISSVRRGYALALGSLSPHIIASNDQVLDKVLKALLAGLLYDENHPPEFKDAEVRQNAAIALREVVKNVGVHVKLPKLGFATSAQSPVLPDCKLSCLSEDQVTEVISGMVTACEDYEIDDRGDVGSLVRCEAMSSLVFVVRYLQLAPGRVQLLHRQCAALGTSSGSLCVVNGLLLPRVQCVNGGEHAALVRWTSSRQSAWLRMENAGNDLVKLNATEFRILDPLAAIPLGDVAAYADALESRTKSSRPGPVLTVPPMNQRDSFMIKDADIKAMSSAHSQTPVFANELGSYDVSSACLRGDWGTKIVGSMLKQMCEKLDQVRECAGRCLKELLHTSESLSAFASLVVVDNKEAAKEILFTRNPEAGPIDFKVANDVFPMAVEFLRYESFVPYVLAGVALSVGSITESVSKKATQALIAWCKAEKEKGHWSVLNVIAREMVSILEAGRKSDRVMVPALKTVDAMLEAQLFDYMQVPKSKWPMQVYEVTAAQLKGTSNVNKLMATINVFLGLANFGRPCRTGAFCSLLILLGYRFPKVRKATAEKFYVWALAMDPQLVCGPNPETACAEDDFLNREVPNPSDEQLQNIMKMVNAKVEHEKQKKASAVTEIDSALLPYEVEIPAAFDAEGAFEEVVEVLMTTVWDGSTKDARAVRDNLYPLLHVKPPKKKDPSKIIVKEVVVQEEDSYANLIHDIKMGY